MRWCDFKPKCLAHLAPGSCVCGAGLNLLHEMVLQFSASEFATGFYQTYYLQLVQEILAVMTGGWHGSVDPCYCGGREPFSLV